MMVRIRCRAQEEGEMEDAHESAWRGMAQALMYMSAGEGGLRQREVYRNRGGCDDDDDDDDAITVGSAAGRI